jgi:hypothetical protein
MVPLRRFFARPAPTRVPAPVHARVPALALATLALSPALTSACSDEAQFTTRFASDFAPAGHRISVLGVFKDGRMNAEAWESIGPQLSAPFGATCDTAYGSLVTGNPALSAAVDDYVRANGPGEDLLTQLAPAASGDVILVFTVAGHVAPKGAPTADPNVLNQGSTPAMGTGKYRGIRPTGSSLGGSRGMRHGPTGPAALEISASLFSVSQHKSVGVVAMAYDGTSADDALQRMKAKLAAAIPGSTCGGWDWKAAPIDESRIRELGH